MDIRVKQRDTTDCGAACLAAVGKYYKLHLPVGLIRQKAGTDKRGTNIRGMLEAAESFGFEAQGVKGSFEALFGIPLPAIAHLELRGSFHHYVVISSVAKTYIEVMDPADGNLNKKSLDEFKKEWTGVLILLLPSVNFRASIPKINTFGRFWLLIRPHRTFIIKALVAALIYTTLGFSTSIFIQKIVDHIIPRANFSLLVLLGMAMVFMLCLRTAAGVLKSVFILRTSQLIDSSLVLGYYKHLLKLPQQFFDSMRIGELISRTSDAIKIRLFVSDIAVNLMVCIFILLGALTLTFTYFWKLALIIVFIVPVYSFIYFITNQLNKRSQRNLMEDSAEFESQLVESLNAIGTIKRFGLEEYSNGKIEAKFMRLLSTVYRSSLNSIFSGISTEFASQLVVIILLWAGAGFVLGGQISTGELLSFYTLIGYFTGPVISFISANKAVQDALIAADRLFDIMDLDCEKPESDGQIVLNNQNLGNISFRNVSFRYGSRADVFSDLTMEIPLNSMTGIVGESGCGKSTLIALLQNIYPLNGGDIFIGAHSITTISNRSLRRVIGIVPQVTDLFCGSIISNIAPGHEEVDMPKVWALCKRLGIISLIEALPQGFETAINENGIGLSGGQRQRIAIARALYRNPEILILDEATSSLDPVSERYVQDTICSFLREGKTVIVIAHRLTSMQKADKIIVLKDGHVAEEGSHSELMALKSAYYRLWEKHIPVG